MNYRTALITGASSGIGHALCLQAAAEGTHVFVAARREPPLEELARTIRARGGKADVVLLDVTKTNEVARTIERIDAEAGGLDLVVANAGINRECWGGDLRFQDLAAIIDVNVRGALATLTALLPKMTERQRGHLVGISSLAQYRGMPRNAAYCASKAFLSTFLEGLRIDVARTGVRVSDVRPGFVRTPLTDGHEFPMPFMLEPEEAAQIIWSGIKRGDPVIAFPWQMAALARATRLLPSWAFDPAVRHVRG